MGRRQDIVTLDVETENTGFDIEGGNKRLISIQLLSGMEEKLYYDGSETAGMDAAKKDLVALIARGTKFVGFHIKGFDLPQIKQFLGVTIPESQVIEIGELPGMELIRRRLGKQRPRLEEVCAQLGIDCAHKALMDRHAMTFKNLPAVIEQARSGAPVLSKDRGWGLEFCYNLVLDRISGGMAILDAFNEFLQKGGHKESLFYRYAMGDVHVEQEVYQRLQSGSASR